MATKRVRMQNLSKSSPLKLELEPFANDKLSIKLKHVFIRVKLVVQNRRNAGFQDFLPSLPCFQKPYFLGPQNSRLCGKVLILYQMINLKPYPKWKHLLTTSQKLLKAFKIIFDKVETLRE